MSLAGVLDVLADDAAVKAALDLAASGQSPAHLDLTAPSPLRSFLIAALAAKAGRPVLAVTATGRESEDLVPRSQSLLARGLGRRVPRVGDAAARAALAAGRHRRPAARRPAPARAPDDDGDPRPARCRSSWRPSAACCSRRSPASVTSSRSALRPGDEAELDDVVTALVEARLRPGRHGREARRVRRPRRHPRRLPADRGAPAAGRVLRRRGRGDPLLLGRRPALASRSPRTACARPPCRELLLTPEVRATGRGAAHRHPGLAEMLDQARRRHPGRGHGGARAGPGRRAGPAPRRAAGRAPTSSSPTPSGSAPGPPTSPGPARSSSTPLVERRRRRCGADRPRRGRLPSFWPSPRRTPSAIGHAVVDASSPFTADERRGRPDSRVVSAREPEPYRGDTAKAAHRRARLAGQGLARRAGHRGPRPGRAAGSRCSAAPTSAVRLEASIDTAPDPGDRQRDAPAASTAGSSPSGC